jgi:NAD(P)-dependent dehydrogenase (short-subunit alcohol dehydrogenase family)
MKVLIVGASGTIGRAVAAELGKRHDVIAAGRSSGEVRIDITDPASIAAAFKKVGRIDAVVSAAGHVKFAPLAEMSGEDFEIGNRDKLMGQVNLVLIGRESVADGGSFTLTTGVLDSDPIRGGSSASLVNSAVNGFVMAAAIELPRGLRINAVSPGLIEESAQALAAFFPGFETVPAARAALAYARSVEGSQTGRVYRVL